MKAKKYTEEQIIAVLKEGEAGARVADLCRKYGMSDATYYSAWDDLLNFSEPEVSNATSYTTKFYYDDADRLTSIIYPSGENVTQTYNGRSLPYSLSGSVAGDIVDSTTYNTLGLPTQISFHNGLNNTYQYWSLDHGTDSYGKLWNISVGRLLDVDHTWDEGGNMVTRFDDVTDQTGTFTYDFLDRLTAVSGACSRSYAYDELGNITSFNGVSYGYDSTQPHENRRAIARLV